MGELQLQNTHSSYCCCLVQLLLLLRQRRVGSLVTGLPAGGQPSYRVVTA